MSYNLTENQKELTRQIVGMVRSEKIPEAFLIQWFGGEMLIGDERKGKQEALRMRKWLKSELNALSEAKLLVQEKTLNGNSQETGRRCTLTARAYQAVDANFAEDEGRPISTLAQPHPPEIAMSLDRLREKYPDPKKLGFLIMRFTAAKPFAEIVDIIKATASRHGLTVLRADEQEFHSDLWGNIRTYLHGCGFGIAVYERIETNEPNANVGLEVGYLLAMNKPVLLLKDKTVPAIQTDLVGKLYKPFDPHDPERTIPQQLEKWLKDYGILV